MTYSNRTSENPSPSTANPAPRTAKANDPYFTAFAPVYQAAAAQMYMMLSWVCFGFENSLRSGFERDTKAFKLAISGLALMMCLLPGTREEKTAFFEKLCAKLGERLLRLRAAYIVWRQRKCWMWGGGLRNRAMAVLPDVYVAALDERSFDALIPDW